MRGRSDIVGVGSFSQGLVRFDLYLPPAKYNLPQCFRSSKCIYNSYKMKFWAVKKILKQKKLIKLILR